MLVPISSLDVGDYRGLIVKKAKIINSRLSPGTRTEIELPKYKDYVEGKIKSGDKLELHLGYTSTGFIEELNGYVSSVSPLQPLKIIAQDAVFKLRNIIKKEQKGFNLLSIVNQIRGEVPLGKCNKLYSNKDYHGGQGWTAKNFIRFVLAPRAGVDFYIRDGKIFLVRPFTELKDMPDSKIPLFVFGKNIISHELFYKEKDTTYTGVMVVSEDSKGMILDAKAGGGNRIKYINQDGLSQSEVRKRAQDYYKLLSYEGWVGKFTTFGYPSVVHSQPIAIFDRSIHDVPYMVCVDEVVKEFSENSYRQTIRLAKYERV